MSSKFEFYTVKLLGFFYRSIRGFSYPRGSIFTEAKWTIGIQMGPFGFPRVSCMSIAPGLKKKSEGRPGNFFRPGTTDLQLSMCMKVEIQFKVAHYTWKKSFWNQQKFIDDVANNQNFKPILYIWHWNINQLMRDKRKTTRSNDLLAEFS